MKKFFVFFVMVMLVLSTLLSGCGSAEADRDEELKESLESTYEELTATFSGATGQYDLVAEYLQSWASKNDITISANEENYMVLENPATEGVKNAESTVLQCSIDTNSLGNSLQSLAISLTSLLGPLEHGDITLIITETNDGEYIGASTLDTGYLKCDNFINMTQNDDVELYTSGSYAASSVMSADISTEEPYYPHAYAITMKISGHHDPFKADDTDYPNPVEVIGNLLANEKSSGQLFQLASFNCEMKSGYIPTSATAVVIIDTNDISSFEKKFKSSYNNMKKKFEKLESNFVYTFTETAMPEEVMSSETGDNIISLMYTLKTGKYAPDEEDDAAAETETSEEEAVEEKNDDEEVFALAEISNISTTGGKFILETSFRGTNEEMISDLSEVYLTTSTLCDIDYQQSGITVTWPSKDNTELAGFFADALGAEETVFNGTVESSECNIFASKANLNMISYQCNIHHGEAALSNICNFLTSLTVK